MAGLCHYRNRLTPRRCCYCWLVLLFLLTSRHRGATAAFQRCAGGPLPENTGRLLLSQQLPPVPLRTRVSGPHHPYAFTLYQSSAEQTTRTVVRRQGPRESQQSRVSHDSDNGQKRRDAVHPPETARSASGALSRPRMTAVSPSLLLQRGRQSLPHVRVLSWSAISASTSTTGALSLAALAQAQATAREMGANVQTTAKVVGAKCHAAARHSATNFWWSLPSLLCLVPLYTLAAWQTMPTTPGVWKLVNMELVWQHLPPSSAASVVAAFLASNVSYLIAAAYLLRSRGISGAVVDPENSKKQQRGSICSNNGGGILIPASLGWWTLLAGAMSTVFHTVQAVGDYGVAEALCYWDHGIAGTAILYFWYACGRPSPRAWLCASAGVAALAFPVAACPPIYPWLHSLWHVLSALAAVVWARDAALAAPSTTSATTTTLFAPKLAAAAASATKIDAPPLRLEAVVATIDSSSAQ